MRSISEISMGFVRKAHNFFCGQGKPTALLYLLINFYHLAGFSIYIYYINLVILYIFTVILLIFNQFYLPPAPTVCILIDLQVCNIKSQFSIFASLLLGYSHTFNCKFIQIFN